MLCFVQFMHPGTEHGPSHGKWNSGPHHRKFLATTGDYVDAQGQRHYGADLCFWGEWEPQSTVSPLQSLGPDYPHYLHKPYLNLAQRGIQNTDPFVFAEPFLYYWCQQGGKNNRMRNLDPGSVVLFGSYIHNGGSPYFGVDTVFVVGPDPIPYSDSNYPQALAGMMPRDFPDIAFPHLASAPAAQGGTGCGSGACGGASSSASAACSNTFYRGATFGNPFGGMYSFVPCRLWSGGQQGFERLKVTHADLAYITDTLTQGRRLNKGVSLADCQSGWQAVRNLCRQQGLLEGLKFNY